MSIEDRNLKPGTVLVARYKKRDHRCDVVKGEDGKVVFKVGNKEYTSPSAAGSAVMGGTACNGWRFWSVEGTEKPKTSKPATKASTPATTAKKASKGTKRTPKAAKVAGGANGEREPEVAEQPAPTESPVSCGDCGQEFPTSHEAGEHMRDTHTSPEAAGIGG